jgi:hypothetical protein
MKEKPNGQQKRPPKKARKEEDKTGKTKGDKEKEFEVTGSLKLLQNDKAEVSIISSFVRWPSLSTTLGAVHTGRHN